MASEKRPSIICIVHYNPIELYPPVMNAVRYLESKKGDEQIYLFTTHAFNAPFIFSSEKCRIFRVGTTSNKLSWFHRLYTYIAFNVFVLLSLILRSPKVVLYFETFSAFGPVFYKKLIRKAVPLFIHYHEYVSPVEYETGMKLVKWFHSMEKGVYQHATWISQTNEKRMELFLNDIKTTGLKNTHIMPNYPPESWRQYGLKRTKHLLEEPIRLLYVGSTNLENLYFREIAEWVAKMNGKFTLTVYSLSIPDDVLGFLSTLGSKHISIGGKIAYYELPSVLTQFDIGLILYKGHTPNWQYNIPNKLFEYHMCGLDVWVPLEVSSSLTLQTSDTFPQIRQIPFDSLETMDWLSIVDRQTKSFYLMDQSCESEYEKLWQAMVC